MFLCNAAAAAHRICQVNMLPTARWKARDIRSAVVAAGCFFLRKNKIALRTASARGQLIAQARVAGCCGPKKAPTDAPDGSLESPRHQECGCRG